MPSDLTPDLAGALEEGCVVLDGGLATELERRGHDLSSALWSARLLADDPAAVVEAHGAFLDSGAQVVTTASYQASFGGFAAAGLDTAGTRELLRRSVALARQAVAERVSEDRPTWVAASVGPYGAALADGSEYTGAYGDMLDVRALRRFHHDRLAALVDAGPDVLALETLPALAEVEALVAELDGLGVPAWVSLTTVTDADGTVLTRRGEPAAEAFAVARDAADVIAVGVNCTDPDAVVPAVRLAAEVSGKPVVLYPNSGESWDAAARRWTGPSHFHPEAVTAWRDAGARLIGGCCRVTPDTIGAVAGTLGAIMR
ncbi:MAG TPA: homocysteine S-methyltransferase [Kineosporiaceae bacterium]|nr:homocysteine S-methyltransferase [Kineosporiaceae bacterium]